MIFFFGIFALVDYEVQLPDRLLEKLPLLAPLLLIGPVEVVHDVVLDFLGLRLIASLIGRSSLIIIQF